MPHTAQPLWRAGRQFRRDGDIMAVCRQLPRQIRDGGFGAPQGLARRGFDVEAQGLVVDEQQLHRSLIGEFRIVKNLVLG